MNILLIVIIAVLSILFLLGVVVRLLQRFEKPMQPNPLGGTLLRIAGALLIILAVIAIGNVLSSSIMVMIEERHNPLAWVALLIVFFPLCLGLFSGIFGVIKSNDLKKARTLRTLAITTVVLVGILYHFGARAISTPVLTIGLVLLILFFIGAQINYVEHKKITSAILRGERLY